MKRNALLIGAFVLAALTLMVAGVLWLSGNSLFRTQQQAMIYYTGNVTGLYVGAPVSFRGVAIGQVEQIDINVDPETLTALIPVRIRLRSATLRFDNEHGKTVDLPALVQRGLRARLVAQSFVTGQKSIELDFVPKTDAMLVGDGSLPEIPALGERFGALIDQVAELPLKAMVEDIRETVQELRNTLTSVQGTLDGAQALMTGAQGVLTGATKEIAGAGTASRETLQAATEAIREVQKNSAATLASITRLSDTARSTVTGAQPELKRTLEGARDAANAARVAMNRVAEMTAPNATLRGDLDAAVRDLSLAARGLRDWSEVLQEKPNAIIFGNKRE